MTQNHSACLFTSLYPPQLKRLPHSLAELGHAEKSQCNNNFSINSITHNLSSNVRKQTSKGHLTISHNKYMTSHTRSHNKNMTFYTRTHNKCEE